MGYPNHPNNPCDEEPGIVEIERYFYAAIPSLIPSICLFPQHWFPKDKAKSNLWAHTDVTPTKYKS